MFSLIHFDKGSGVAIYKENDIKTRAIVPFYEYEKSIDCDPIVLDSDELYSTDVWDDMKHELNMMQQTYAIDIAYSLFFRLNQASIINLSPEESIKMLIKHIEFELKKDVVSERLISEIYAVRFAIGIEDKLMDKICVAIQKRNPQQSKLLSLRTRTPGMNWQKSSSLLIQYIQDRLLPNGMHKEAKAILLFIAKIGKDIVGEKIIKDAASLFKFVVNDERVYLFKTGQQVEGSWKKGLPTRPGTFRGRDKKQK